MSEIKYSPKIDLQRGDTITLYEDKKYIVKKRVNAKTVILRTLYPWEQVSEWLSNCRRLK